jgi:hypothetical protein
LDLSAPQFGRSEITITAKPPLHFRNWIRRNAVAVSTYLIATLLTSAHFTGDTLDYAASVAAYQRGQYLQFWEFGHLLWRPLGWLLLQIFAPVLVPATGDLRLAATYIFTGISWLAGLGTVLSLSAILRRFCPQTRIVNFTIIVFSFSHGFLNFAQTGPPYIASLLAMVLSLYVLLRKDNGQLLSLTDGIVAGVAIALMIAFWLPFIVVVPAILAARLLLSTSRVEDLKVVIGAGCFAGLLVIMLYLVVAMWPLGIRNVGDFLAWQKQTTGRTVQDKGLARAAFGFPRSFIYMGNDGMTLKRYLVRDPYNPVTTLDLLRLSLWKIALFYLCVASLLGSLLRSARGRRLLILLLISAVPVLGVAIYWQGGDIERYLPLYPMVFMALTFILSDQRSKLILNGVAVLFFVCAAATNLHALSFQKQNERQEKIAARIADLIPNLKPSSRLFVVNYQDELYSFSRDFPFNPINASKQLTVNSLLEVGAKDAPRWRQDFASAARTVWREGGDVWITRRLLEPRPLLDWNWVEGDDRRVSWADLYNFISKLEIADSAHGDDGFVQVLNSAQTRSVLDQAQSN